MQENDIVSIGYTLMGSGTKKVILLHSWMDDAETWKLTTFFLDFQQFAFAFMDVRGYGKSKNLTGKFNSDEIAGDVFNLADELGWKEFYLVGHSMSGMAAQKAALLDPSNRIIKVLLITPVSSAGFPADEPTKLFFQSMVQNDELSKVALELFTENRLSETWKKNRAQRHIAVTNQDAQLAYINMWTNENFQQQMESVKKPFLIVTGKYDMPLFRLKKQKEEFANFRNVQFIEIESSGHFPMQETPAYLAAKIEDFFA